MKGTPSESHACTSELHTYELVSVVPGHVPPALMCLACGPCTAGSTVSGTVACQGS